MTEVGRMLEEARLRKGITLDRVEAELKIRKHYLLAMEAGRWEELPGYAYATGFLRTYGEYLGLSGDDLVEEYKYWRELQGIDTIADEPPVGVFTRAKELQTDAGIFQLSAKDQGKTRRRRKIHRGLVVILILVVALAAYIFLTWKQPFLDTGLEPTPPNEAGIADHEVPQLPELEVIDDSSANGPELFMDEEAAADPSVDGVPEGRTGSELSSDIGEMAAVDPEISAPMAPEIALEAEEPTIQRESQEEPEPFSAGELTTTDVEVTLPDDQVYRLPTMELADDAWPLILEAMVTDRCWVEVRSDGELLVSRTLEPGEHYIWNASQEIRVRLGNAAGVKLRLNDQELGPAGEGVVTRVFTADAD
ncbi:MAG: helix-turn-helix domain-containing protein [Firmicutes bacterium]|nr:helix-turn-helix domain-containing protein [Bacillota bacterium]